MLKYVSIKVEAYRDATGKSVEEALRDLAIDSFVSGVDLEQVPKEKLLSSISIDTEKIKNWVQASKEMSAQ